MITTAIEFIGICIFSYLYMMSDAIRDNITFHRIHLAKHPCRDVWHAAKHCERITLGAIFILFTLLAMASELLTFVSFLALWGIALVPLKKLWALTALSNKDYWYNADETWKLTTGSTSLDKWLGFEK